MAERLIEKLDRLGAEAGIKQMAPEVYRFALDVRKDLVSEWPKRPWEKLTEEERASFDATNPKTQKEWDELFDGIEAKLKEKNNG